MRFRLRLLCTVAFSITVGLLVFAPNGARSQTSPFAVQLVYLPIVRVGGIDAPTATPTTASPSATSAAPTTTLTATPTMSTATPTPTSTSTPTSTPTDQPTNTPTNTATTTPTLTPTPGNIRITIEAAGVDQDTLHVVANISSLYELSAVRARVEDRETVLVFDSGRWRGSLSLLGLEYGGRTLIVEATNVFDEMARAERSFIVDRAPTLTVHGPMDGTVSRGTLRLTASCADDDPAGCSTLTVARNNCGVTTLATGQDSIDTEIDVSAYDGGRRSFCFKAVDSVGHTVSETRYVFVETSSRLQGIASIPGELLDADAGRILFVDRRDALPVLTILDRASGEQTVIRTLSPTSPLNIRGLLTPRGAFYSVRPERDNILSEWRDGLHIRYTANASRFQVAGNFAAWIQKDGLHLRDIEADTETLIATIRTPIQNDQFNVAANGDVVYSDGSIYRYRDGDTTLLAGGPEYSHQRPLTDGSSVAWTRTSASAPSQREIVYYSPMGTISVVDGLPDGYQLNNGWLAFLRPGPTGQTQVWTRSPAGDETQISFFSTFSVIDVLGPTGELTFINNNRRYLSRPGAPPVEIGGYFMGDSRSLYFDGTWHVILGRRLFEVLP